MEEHRGWPEAEMARAATVEAYAEPVQEKGRVAVLEKAVGEILKRFGDGSIMRLGEAADRLVEVIPTGSLALDLALGVGGVPRGRGAEIYGPEASGKRPLCPHT